LQRQRKDDEAYETFLAMVQANRMGNVQDDDVEIPDDVVIDESTLHTLGYALRPMRKSEFILGICVQELIVISQFRN
jgi:hypothetical protein